MLTEKIIFVYRNIRYTDAEVLFIPDDISIRDLTEISIAGGTLLWNVAGALYLVPPLRIENTVLAFEDADKMEGRLIDPLVIEWHLGDMQKVGPIILPLL